MWITGEESVNGVQIVNFSKMYLQKKYMLEIKGCRYHIRTISALFGFIDYSQRLPSTLLWLFYYQEVNVTHAWQIGSDLEWVHCYQNVNVHLLTQFWLWWWLPALPVFHTCTYMCILSFIQVTSLSGHWIDHHWTAQFVLRDVSPLMWEGFISSRNKGWLELISLMHIFI